MPETIIRRRWARLAPAILHFIRLPHPVPSELAVIGASLYFTVFSNSRYWMAWASGRDWSDTRNWSLVLLMVLLLTALHCVLLGLLVSRRGAKPMLATLFVAAALASFYTSRYTVFFDAGMVRNIVQTDFKEARELLTWAMAGHVVLFGVLPALAVLKIDFAARPLRDRLTARALLIALSTAVAAGSIAFSFQDLSAVMRNQRELRYLITPANFLVSGARVALAGTAAARKARLPVGTDAVLGGAWAGRSKPLLLVVIVGETVRAANWGLNGYARQTTPQLAQLGVVNFPRMSSCGTSTQVSVPCMFSPYGRANYDEDAIRSHESVLHVLQHAVVKTLWRDNQSGCKGVCDGLSMENMSDTADATLCGNGQCRDEILLADLEATLKNNSGPLVLVLHQLGNHGPAYSSRYPQQFRRFTPTCDTADLGKCTREQIVNSYDNAVTYTDHVVAEAIRRLGAQSTHEAALVYVSDHGESLGENGVYLHGIPYAIAPREQTEVPLAIWLSPGYSASTGITASCLRKRARSPASHDNLFHTMLGMMQVDTGAYVRGSDLSAGCMAGQG